MMQLTNDNSVLSKKDSPPIQSNTTSYSISGTEFVSDDVCHHFGVTIPQPSVIAMIAY